MPPDLLLIVVDTARADAFSPWGGSVRTPVLERLGAEGLVYEQAISAAPWTLPSTATLFTGRWPSEHRIDARAYRWVDERPTSPAGAVGSWAGPWLPESLREAGYRTWGVSCNPWVSHWGGFDRGFDALIDVRPWPPLPKGRVGWAARRSGQMLGRGDHGGREALDLFERWLSEDRRAPDGGGPRFGFVNLMEMHSPYDPPLRHHPLWRGRAFGLGDLRRQFRQMDLRQRPDPRYVAAIRALYASSAAYTDALIGRFVRAFVDGAREVQVVVVSDHGENLGDHGLFAHHSSLHESLLHVPMVLWGRGMDVGPGRVSEPVSTAGVPTWLLAVASGGGEPPGPGGGVRSEYESTQAHIGMPREIRARAARDGDQALPGLVHHAGLALRTGSLKYVGLDDGTDLLVDLASDPDETIDVAGDHPSALGPLRAARAAWLAELAGRGEVAFGDAAELEIADHLKTLGYIE